MQEHSVRLVEEEAVIPPSPFKSYPEIAALIDILSRQEQHHIVLVGPASKKIQQAIMHGIAQQLRAFSMPRVLDDVEIIYLTIEQFHQKAPLKHDKEYQRLIIFAQPSNYQKLMQELSDDFTVFHWNERNEAESALALKTFATELENFHRVSMTNDLFSSAVSMASHYLPGASCLEKALALLDSASARASASATERHTTEQKPLVSSTHLAQVIANHTRIPLSHVQNNQFQALKFIEAMQHSVFGQEIAIERAGMLLQTACIKLQKNAGPLCSLLLVGAQGVGKTTFAYAMAEHLFGSKDALLLTNLQQLSLLFAGIQKAPYSIVLVKNIEQLSPALREVFKNILLHGEAVDEFGNRYDFRHAMIVMTTSLGASRIAQHLGKESASKETAHDDDLMQLVLNSHLSNVAMPSPPLISSEDIYDDILSSIEEEFSPDFLQNLNIVPFVALEFAALEKIMHVKLKALVKQLDLRFGLELYYAPEVIKFLAQAAKHKPKSLDKLFEQLVYASITRAMLTFAAEKNKSKQLLLQLNDHGQVLHCEFITANEAPLYHR